MRILATTRVAAILKTSSHASRRSIFSLRASAVPATQNMAPAVSNNLQVIKGLEPEPLWRFFAQLSEIPRPSKQEERVLAWLRDFAAARKLEFQQDSVGNVVIRRPGSGGGEGAPSVLLQGHVDMVCEKNNDTVHDFTKDPIRLVIDGDWLKADGTTLGSDNGIGVCASLALLDAPPSALLPPLEALFTIDEETGLTGAFGLDGSMIRSRIMLNLDTEDINEIITGCAGGGDTRIVMPARRASVVAGAEGGHVAYSVSVRGLMGGHSGVNIHEDRGNAVIFLARALGAATEAVAKAGGQLLVTEIAGGDKRNAIPREGGAEVLVPKAAAQAFESSIAATSSALRAEYGHKEPGMVVEATAREGGAAPETALEVSDTVSLLNLIRSLPHGPAKFSHVIPGLVETSNNVASVKLDGPRALVVCSTRSSIMPALEAHRDRLELIAKALGAEAVEREEAYPGWAPNPSSKILTVAVDKYKETFGRAPHVGAIHAGLECGILGDKVPGIDCVSFGPTITGAHSPDERILLSTVPPFFKLLVNILESVAKTKA